LQVQLCRVLLNASATLERGFEGMARGIERGQEFAFKQAEAEKERIADAPVKGAQRREAHARASVFELQAEDARRAAIEERDVQNVYERVTKRYLAANPKATKPPAAEIARELFAMGKYKQGQAALMRMPTEK